MTNLVVAWWCHMPMSMLHWREYLLVLCSLALVSLDCVQVCIVTEHAIVCGFPAPYLHMLCILQIGTLPLGG